MRERHSFVQVDGATIDPASLQIGDKGISGPSVRAVKEVKFSFTEDEVPADVHQVLRQFERVSARWISPLKYETLDPFSSRLPPGLHVSVTLKKGREALQDPHILCGWLRKLGKNIDCDSPDVYVQRADPGNGLISFRLYQQLDDLHDFVEFSRWTLCDQRDTICHHRHRDLYTSSSLDVVYDGVSRTLKMSSFWPLREHHIIAPQSSRRRVEIGILGRDVPPEMKAHEMGVSGTLTVLGEHQTPSPTLFSFPTRHRLLLDTEFTARFLSPTGLHPTLQLTMNSGKGPDAEGVGTGHCAPYVYLTLPKSVFADRYQLADDLFLRSKNLTASRYVSEPVDLEAPAYTTTVWGSTVLLQMSKPEENYDSEGSWTVEIPLHLRYREPSATGTVREQVPYPAVFWACEVGDGDGGAPAFATNPFDRTDLGYDGLFGDATTFWHVSPRPLVGDRLYNEIEVPVLKQTWHSAHVSLGTGTVVAVGFLWVLWKLISSVSGGGGDTDKDTIKKE